MNKTCSKEFSPCPTLSPKIKNVWGPRVFNNKIVKTMRLNIQLVTAAVLSVGGLVLLFCGVYIAPQGEIHESLLVGFGEVATFAGALFGIDYTYKFKQKGEQR